METVAYSSANPYNGRTSARLTAIGGGLPHLSYYLWRSKFGGTSVSDAKRLKELETENSRLKKLLAESQLEIEVTREVLRKQW